MRKLVFGVSNLGSDTNPNQTVQPQKMVRGLKFQIHEVEGLCYLCSKNKGADQLCCYRKLICAFVFAYAKSRFSHDAANFLSKTSLKLEQTH